MRTYQFRDRDRQIICGITVTQCYAIDFLAREGRLTILDIGRRLVLNKSNASRLVDALEGLGLVSRALDPTNHRIRWIELTPTGRRLQAEIAENLKREYTAILESFSPAFVRQVSRLLEALAESAGARVRQSGQTVKAAAQSMPAQTSRGSSRRGRSR
jgi:DNA-binding MarR family transcriptional regulator